MNYLKETLIAIALPLQQWQLTMGQRKSHLPFGRVKHMLGSLNRLLSRNIHNIKPRDTSLLHFLFLNKIQLTQIVIAVRFTQ